MKSFLFLLTITSLTFSCVKKNTYNCTVTHHTNLGAGVDFVFKKEYRGTYEQMLAYEAQNTDSTKTTTCH